jgi:hypothetical protein
MRWRRSSAYSFAAGKAVLKLFFREGGRLSSIVAASED